MRSYPQSPALWHKACSHSAGRQKRIFALSPQEAMWSWLPAPTPCPLSTQHSSLRLLSEPAPTVGYRMAGEFKPSFSISPNIEGVFTTLQIPEPQGSGRARAFLVVPWSAGLINPLLGCCPHPPVLPRDSHLPGIIFELSQPPPRYAQALPCRLEAPVSAVLLSSRELFWGKQEEGSWGSPRCKDWKLAPGWGLTRRRSRRFAWLGLQARVA